MAVAHFLVVDPLAMLTLLAAVEDSTVPRHLHVSLHLAISAAVVNYESPANSVQHL